MAKAKLTKRTVESIAPGPRDVIVWDTDLPGFHLKVSPQGRRKYFLYYRTKAGRQRKPAVGVHGQITAEQARTIARLWSLEVANGEDPSKSRQESRRALTVADLCDRFIEEYSRLHHKATTHANYKRQIRAIIKPRIGSKKITDVSRDDIQRIHYQMRASPYQANRLLQLISKLFNLAERWELRPDYTNPARRIERYKEHARDRFLSAAELERLACVLREVEQECSELPSVVPALRLLVATGCRLSEILTMRWDRIDFERRRINLSDSKTGAKRVYLNAVAYDALVALREEQIDEGDFVLPGEIDGAPIINLQKPWRRIRERAGLVGVRIHDLRHTFASIAAGLGEGLPVIGKLLGHTQAQTTLRYAHLADNPMEIASNKIGDALKSFSVQR
jgi:integrase